MIRPDKAERIEYKADYQKDTAYSAYARLLQSKWRTKKDFPEGKEPERKSSNEKETFPAGSYLEEKFAKEKKANFLTDNIKFLVTQEIENAKETGALISEPRIWNNLLSSQPLCFNLFGEFYFDLNLATLFFQHIFPGRLDKVMAIKFEYSPGRGDPKYLGDRSAFDVFVEYRKGDKKGFIGIEVKYAESLKEETNALAKKRFEKRKEQTDRYTDLTYECGLFKPDCVDLLRMPPLSQIWRDHLLSIATNKDYDEGFFVFLFPRNNSHCQNVVDSYKQLLVFDNEARSGFYPRYLDDFIDTLTVISSDDWVNDLKQRYIGTDE